MCSIETIVNNLNNDYLVQQGVRYVQIAVPFARFVPGAKGVANSSFFDVVDAGSHLFGAVQAKNRRTFVKESLRTVQSVTSSVSSRVNNLSGIYFSSVLGVFLDGYQVAEDFWEGGEKKNYYQDSVLLVSSIFSAVTLVTSSKKIAFAALTFHAVRNVYEVSREWKQEKKLEAFAKFALSAIYGFQAKNACSNCKTINVEEEDFDVEECFDAYAEAVGGPIENPLIFHPLYNLNEMINKHCCILRDHKGNEINFGANFHGFGKGLVKGMNIRFFRSGGKTELRFELNHVFQKKFQGEVFYYGKNRKYLNNQVRVILDKDESFDDLFKFLSERKLQDVIMPSTQEDITRLKIGQMFRLYFPKEATLLDHSDEFFSLSLSQLRKKVVTVAPTMEPFLTDENLKKLQPREILPGRVRYCYERLGNLLKERGVTYISAHLTGNSSFDNIASILKIGMLSSRMRESLGIDAGGLENNHDSVFFQLDDSEGEYECFGHGGSIKVKVDSDVIETGTYQYAYDEFGTREFSSKIKANNIYLNRPTIFCLINELKGNEDRYSGNEVMVKDRVPPEKIVGVEVENNDKKNKLSDFLRMHGIVTKNENSEEMINGKPLHQFITVASA